MSRLNFQPNTGLLSLGVRDQQSFIDANDPVDDDAMDAEAAVLVCVTVSP